MENKAICGNCKSDNVFGMSRVVGYYSIIENWNDSKQAEFSDRQRGVYAVEEKVSVQETSSSNMKEEAIAVIAR